MKIHFNGNPLELESDKKLSELLRDKGYKKSVVVFLNKKKLLMKEVAEYIIREHDVIGVFRPLSGG